MVCYDVIVQIVSIVRSSAAFVDCVATYPLWLFLQIPHWSCQHQWGEEDRAEKFVAGVLGPALDPHWRKSQNPHLFVSTNETFPAIRVTLSIFSHSGKPQGKRKVREITAFHKHYWFGVWTANIDWLKTLSRTLGDPHWWEAVKVEWEGKISIP